MSELDKTIEELEAEVLAELEEAAHDAPTKGAAPAEKTQKVKPDGVNKEEDGGKAVVDPEEKSSPTDVAAKGAKEVGGDAQQKGEGAPEKMAKLKKVKEEVGYTDDEIRELFTHKNVNIRRGSDGNIDTIMPPRYDLVYQDYEFQKK